MADSTFHVREHVIPSSYIREYPRATSHPQEDVLDLCVKQYVPCDFDSNDPRPSITIIGAHANGFPKELYEPLWQQIYSGLKAKGITVRGIWIEDAAHQGQSGIRNASKLGNEPSWYDHSRDLFLMINHFRHEMSRPLVGIGHSMGALQLIQLALLHPRLLSTLVIIEPVLVREPFLGSFHMAAASLVRREAWPSRAAAAETFAKSKFYQTWDSRVLALWTQYGLQHAPDEQNQDRVLLTTSKHQEVASFVRHRALDDADAGTGLSSSAPDYYGQLIADTRESLYKPEPLLTFQQLPTLRPSALYVFGTSSPVSSLKAREDKVKTTGIGVGGSGGAARDRVRQVSVDAGHLTPLENVDGTASECVAWLEREYGLWLIVEQREQDAWAAIDPNDKSKVSEDIRRALPSASSQSNRTPKAKL